MNEVLLSLKQQLAHIAALIPDKENVLYFDYPLHLNVGDLLIYAGTEQFFQDYGIHIRLRRCLQAFDIEEAQKYVNKGTTILCHGGGNFGDLYPSIHRLREELVRRFPENRIIVLPQTAYFSDQAAMERSAAIFARHQDCHLFARDDKTLQIMMNFSSKVRLSPDMAHQLYGCLAQKNSQPGQRAVEKTLYFLRKDIEASQLEKEIQSALSAGDEVKDWQDILSQGDMRRELLYSRLSRLANKFRLAWLKDWINNSWYSYSMALIERCRQVFVAYDSVVTSRLHGHIFSCLLGVPNRVCDNSYGKNTGYYRQWTKDIDYVSLYEKE
ncbi:polysaccharide pyruvyl transferase family protein [Mesocricetibacter intestinalis]|uniref:polysaccharide pyruvyl transferase family protein n=1 Tax=Mesocricetibacter intestinalis TaxID=1521930 RepID=UPI00105EC2DF|nr:polysaccharide pyruvyl transferase family protein [Mesocricetibacter intestinalis]